MTERRPRDDREMTDPQKCGKNALTIKSARKMQIFFVYIKNYYYLCSRKGYETRATMQTDVKHQPNDAPITTDAIGTGNVQKKYYTADEAIAFLEPRIRAMFQ
jgi:hypothetical protein